MKIFLYKAPYILYPFIVLVIVKLSVAYSGNSARSDKRGTSWLITILCVAPTLLFLLCERPRPEDICLFHQTRPGPFVFAAVSTVAGMICAVLGGKHLKLGRTYRAVLAFAGVTLGAWASAYVAYLTVVKRLLEGW